MIQKFLLTINDGTLRPVIDHKNVSPDSVVYYADEQGFCQNVHTNCPFNESVNIQLEKDSKVYRAVDVKPWKNVRRFKPVAEGTCEKTHIEVGSVQFIETDPQRIEKCRVVAEYDGDFVYVVEGNKTAGIASKDHFLQSTPDNDFLAAMTIVSKKKPVTDEELVLELIRQGMRFR